MNQPDPESGPAVCMDPKQGKTSVSRKAWQKERDTLWALFLTPAHKPLYVSQDDCVDREVRLSFLTFGGGGRETG